MSGTSLDGVDAAIIRTDGSGIVEPVSFLGIPYDPETRAMLRVCLGLAEDPDGRVAKAAAAMTDVHVRVVKTILQVARMTPEDVDLIGFHGQTIFHDPENRFTWQIGDAARLAQETGIAVVGDFRSADVRAGGQGAPLIPVYHAALAHDLEKPVAVLNIGGVANVTYIDDKTIIACDTGPGNALIDDWVFRHTGDTCDRDGMLARTGKVDGACLSRLMQNPFFERKPPKSLDRDAWNVSFIQGLSVADGAATLTAFTVRAVAQVCAHLPQTPVAWFVCGGGRHNPAIMEGLRAELGVPVESVDVLGWDGDALEAQGFAYLAVRAQLGLPLSFPETTGVAAPMTGGRIWQSS